MYFTPSSLTALAGLGLPLVTDALGWQPIRELRKNIHSSNDWTAAQTDYDPAKLYPAYNLSVPIDHFHNDTRYEPHSYATFALRYWVDASHYVPGGPIIVLQGGETNGAERLPFLQKGILAQLARATRGIGVVLEHRYYGQSFPLANLTVESMRFLSTEQALADQAYFAQNVRFPLPGLEDVDLSPPHAAWIAYGGSYPGSMAAFTRKLYPDVYWGAISSSGVTVATYDYWQYMEAARLFAPTECVNVTQTIVDVVDRILIGKKDTKGPQRLKEVFGLGNLTNDADFASLLASGITGWQSTNWDPAVSSPRFGYYCANITSDTLLYPELEKRRQGVEELLEVADHGGADVASLTNRTLNYIGWIQADQPCADNKTQDECYTNLNETFFAQDDISQEWRAWPYQVCTQWGYLQTGSGVPADQLPLISRLIDTEYQSVVCRAAFNITSLPAVEQINKLGGFNFSYPRLAFLDGEADPWRWVGVHAPEAPDRTSTSSEPFILIKGGAVHHWDENGLFANETTSELPPGPVAEAQRAEVEFVMAWMDEWREAKGAQDRIQDL
jgi:hypothetical protein